MRRTNDTAGPAALDLNLLRLFEAVYRTRSVSRAAEALGLSQPAASQGLSRLRLQMRDALFVRAGGGVRPTPRADRLASAVQRALATVEEALHEGEAFDPRQAEVLLRLHLSDIGEARFLPGLLAFLRREAPHVQVESRWLPHDQIGAALDGSVIDLAIGYLPGLHGTRHLELLRDRYAVMVRDGHPLLRGGRRAPRLVDPGQLEVVVVRSHAETLRLVRQMGLTERLVSAHFLALPAIVRATDLGVVMPRAVAQGFAAQGGFTVIDAGVPPSEFPVSLHWSPRLESDPAHRWLREQVAALFRDGTAAGPEPVPARHSRP
jgi:DNA-binding transcriptional LysR family regulator